MSRTGGSNHSATGTIRSSSLGETRPAGSCIRVVVYRGVLLYGESGAGKSSLVNAGLFPVA
jgi:putative ribosome biogenesis GTPase RsgA